MKKVILDNQIVDRSDVKIDMEDRGYQFGDGVYEVIRVYGGEVFTIEEHLNRLVSSIEKIKIKPSFTIEELKENLIELVRVNDLVGDGYIYLQITRGATPRIHVFPGEEIKPVLTAYTNVIARPEADLKSGVTTMITDDIRWLRCDIKSLNLLPNILAKQEAKEKDCYEAILHREGVVTEGASSNVFIVIDGQIKTHPANNLILNGITRQEIIHLCKENNIPLLEEAFRLDEMLQADEVFLSSSISEVMPIAKIDGKMVNGGIPGPITRKLQSLFVERIGLG